MKKFVAVIAVVGATLLGTALPSFADSSARSGMYQVTSCNGTRGTRVGSVSATRSGAHVTALVTGQLGSLDTYYISVDQPTSGGCTDIVSTGNYTANNDGRFRKRVHLRVPRSDRSLIFLVVDISNPSDQLNSKVLHMAP